MRQLNLFIFVFLLTLTSQAKAVGLGDVQAFHKKFGLDNAVEKLTDNRGNGFAGLYGTRNFRLVLDGVLYRGGANNMFHKLFKRHNHNPLPADGLQNLCQQGFDTAIYLYSLNFKTAPQTTSCRRPDGQIQTLNYLQINPFKPEGLSKILELVHSRIMAKSDGPIYSHCWNGWHASGFVAASSLRQFCGVTAQDAIAYWDLATDGVNKDPIYEKVRAKIRSFKPDPRLLISPEIQRQICPSLSDMQILASNKAPSSKALPEGAEATGSKNLGVKF
jgi:hypothetical protein